MVETMERQVLRRISASNGCTTIRPPWRCYGLLDENLTLCHHCYGLLDENLTLITEETFFTKREVVDSRALPEGEPSDEPKGKQPPEAGQESVAA
jgi:hypothetical protein